MCPDCGSLLDAERATPRCSACGGLWVLEDTLRHCVRTFVSLRGQEVPLLSFHEAPSGEPSGSCPDCGSPLEGVRLRNVAVKRCRPCGRVFMTPNAIELISQRVLASAQTQKGVPTVSRFLRLDEMLSDPSSFDLPE